MSTKTTKKAAVVAEPVKTTKVPAKPKVAAKVAPTKTSAKPAAKGGKKVANPKNASKNAEAAAKKKAEQQRYDAALLVAAERGLVTIIDELTATGAQDHWAAAVNMHILEVINNIQQNEACKDGDYNPFPSKNFVLLEDKVVSGGKKKTPVKSGKSDTSTAAASKKKKAPIRRGTKPVVEEPEEEPEEDVEVTLDDTPDDESAEASEEVKEEVKEKKKVNITTFTRDAKNYLGFVVMRYVDDYFSSPGGKNVKNRDDFTNFTYTGVTKDITSHVSRSVVTTVNRMHDLVSNLQDRGVSENLSKLVSAHLPDRNSVMKFMGEYLSDYLKLVGYVLAQQLWISRKTINQPAIEAVVRLLEMGNHEALVNAKVVTENESDYGLTCGFHRDARSYGDLTMPKTPKKPRAPGAKKGKTAKAAKADDADDEVEPTEDAEAEGDEVEEDAEDAEAEGDEAEGDDAEEDAEAEPEEEPEPEPEPEPKKSLKTLKKLK